MYRFKIYVDSREKKGYSFRNFPVSTEEKRLKTGDYCISTDGDSMGENSFDPHYAVERKNPSDFLKSITWERDRYEEELARADTFAARMPVVIERGLDWFEEEEYFQDVSLESLMATINTHPSAYNVDYHFKSGRAKAEHLTYEFLNWRYKKLKRRRE